MVLGTSLRGIEVLPVSVQSFYSLIVRDDQPFQMVREVVSRAADKKRLPDKFTFSQHRILPEQGKERINMNANGIHDNTLVPDDTDTDHDEHEEEKDAEKGTDERDAMGEELAKKGHNAIVGLRIGLSVALLSATVAAAVFIFWLTRHQEKEAFQKAFSDNSLKMVEAFQVTAERRLTAVASFGTTVTSYALATNATWPFVTIPQMEARASHVLGLADAVAIAFGPLVHQKDREVWENDYVPSNVGWLEESFEYYEDVLQANTEVTSASDSAATTEGAGLSRSRPGTYEGIPDFSAGYSKQISTIGFTPLGTLGPLIAQGDVLLPWWQRAPSPRNEGGGFINVNLLDDPSFDGDLLEVLQRRRAALGRMSFSGYGNSSYTDGSPVSGFYYPILAGPDPTDSANELVGTLATLVFWNTFFANVLPQNAVGMIAVLSSTCNQTFTFRVDGPSVSSLGQGDLHDPQYDDHRLDVSFTASINKRYTDRQYRGFPVDEEGCQYTLSIYASQELEDTYISNMPIYYTCGAVLISLLTSGLFILYDRLVTNRQRAILRQAEQTGAIVSSLFPAAYRERLIQAQQGRKDAKANSAQKGIEAFTANNDIRAPLSSDEPIADLYENCTVLFADVRFVVFYHSTSIDHFEAHAIF